MSCPSVIVVRVASMLAIVMALGATTEQAKCQAPEVIPPVVTGEATADESSSSEGLSFEDVLPHSCSCQLCARRAPYSRWRDEILPYLQSYYWGHPGNFAAEPMGVSVFDHFNTQVQNAAISRLFLYRYDFNTGPDEDLRRLSAYGQRRLRKLASLMLQTPAPLRIEESGNTDLDEARRHAVLSELRQLLSIEIDPEMVVVVDLPYPRLLGEEAIIHHGQLLQQTQQGTRVNGGGFSGLPAFGSGGSRGGSGGSGSSRSN